MDLWQAANEAGGQEADGADNLAGIIDGSNIHPAGEVGRQAGIDVNSNACPSPILGPSETNDPVLMAHGSAHDGAEDNILMPTPSIPVLDLPEALKSSAPPQSPPGGNGDDAASSPDVEIEGDVDMRPNTNEDISPQLIPTLTRPQAPLIRAKNVSISGSIPISTRFTPMLNGQELPLDSIPNSLRHLQSLSNSVTSSTLRPRQDVLEYLGSIGNTTLRPPIDRLTTRAVPLRSSSHSGSVTIMPGDRNGDEDDIIKRRERRADEDAERERKEAEMSFNSRMRQFERDLRTQTTEGGSSSSSSGAEGIDGVREEMINVIAPKRIKRGDPSANLDSAKVDPSTEANNNEMGRETATRTGGIGTRTGIDEVEVEWCFFCGEERIRSEMTMRQVTLEQRKAMRARALDPLLDDDDGTDGTRSERSEPDHRSEGTNEDISRTRHGKNNNRNEEQTWQWVCSDGCGVDDKLQLGTNLSDPLSQRD
ncbi:hypothetical protein I316_01186 [Kwoniella heveanensis BCC8398]|uniref:Uncharacterized protein n=1 Tax=Kwoniella heveanensis BCC8398 TaxID=1296120 RepID=A0A1B9H219_9TREE|nr:hypothetical protein I316_01186 [Kwoniella heveanensis BCC8398]